jgi:hypothetical protein
MPGVVEIHEQTYLTGGDGAVDKDLFKCVDCLSGMTVACP